MANVVVGDLGSALSGIILGKVGDQLAATLTLTDAQIKTLPSQTSGIQLVAAVGNKINIPIWAAIIGDFAAGAYTNISANGSYIGVSVNAGLGFGLTLIENETASGVTSLNTFLSNSKKAVITPMNLIGNSGIVDIQPNVQTFANYVGNIVLFCVNAAGNFTGGNAANTLKVVLSYVQISAP